MAAIKFRNAGDITSYLYRSKAKIDWLYQQIQRPKEKTTVTWKIDLKFLSRESKREREDEFNDQDKLDAIIAALEDRQMMGPPEDCKEYIKMKCPMRWGIFDDNSFRPNTEGPLVYFSCLVEEVLIGLGGSSIHVSNPYGIGATGSGSSAPALYAWLRTGSETGDRPDRRTMYSDELYEIAEAMALANHYLKGPTQNVEFVAKVLNRGTGYNLRPWKREEKGEVILGTPLYVSQIDGMYVDNI